MKFVLLFVLAALWAVVLVPPLLRARTTRSSDSIGDFKSHLGVLSRTNGWSRRRAARRLPVRSPGVLAPPMRAPVGAVGPAGFRLSAPQRAAKRRRDITLGLVVAATVTLAFAAFAQSSAVWLLQGLVDVLLVGYLGLLVWFRGGGVPVNVTRSRGPLTNVQYLAGRRAPELPLQPTPELALRRTASS